MEMVLCEEDLPLRKVKLSLSEMETLFTWFLSANYLQARSYIQCTRQAVSASGLPTDAQLLSHSTPPTPT